MGTKNKPSVKANLLTTFHAVGQGLFCSNHICFIKEKKVIPFSFIYDCGNRWNSRLLERRMRHFWNVHEYLANGERLIDLFVLSHFHEDHYKGLDYLLKERNGRIDVAIIPYLTWMEKLLILLEEYSEESLGNSETVEIVNEYLLTNEWIKKKANLLIYLGKRWNEEGKREEENEKEQEGKAKDVEPLEEIKLSEIWKSLLSSEEKVEENVYMVRGFWSAYISDSGRKLWEFLFFYPKLDRSIEGKIRKLKEEIKKLIKEKESVDRDVDRIIDNLDENLYKITVILKNEKGSKKVFLRFQLKGKEQKGKEFDIEFEKIKQKINENIPTGKRNETSIICYHSPTNMEEFGVTLQPVYDCYLNFTPVPEWRILFSRFPEVETIAQLYSGDVYAEQLLEIVEKLQSKGKYPFLTQVPHHGSYDSWKEKGKELVKVCKSSYWIITAGIKNTYGHPSPCVFKDISLQGKIPIWVDEQNHFQMRATIDFKV
ncbi:hypothetical protein [Phorcysia thermohydrogeniphila]|uniref:Beta-lactamase superfamily II metal-dependent hydrolase n=1 Tax=Phorcysia thermohydrogeniphila TaxID=936138 RepID=A0A4R1GAD4_9BACT|nr:hypothetical protein [Phorcysia thermohydrogeniphila]TCK04678.1 hypothetical protein CLV27_1111 [Phorcysia thermohydrogeniphila]